MPGQSAGLIRVIKWGQVQRTLEISTSDGGVLLWRVLPFPEMRVTVDGREVEVTEDAATGLLSNHVPAGDHIARWTWRPFPALRWARRVSLAGLFVTLALLLVAAVRRRRHTIIASNPAEAG
jgi:hypothetical protein